MTRLLIVTANFAPRAASPAVRTVNLSRAIALQGHEVGVLTYTEPALLLFSPRDQFLSDKVPPSVQVHRVQAGPVRSWAVRRASRGVEAGQEVRSRMRGHLLTRLAVPDPHVESVPRFVVEARRALDRFRPDAILTFGYPHSLHLVGYALKREDQGVRWFCDYGDPWSGSPIRELPGGRWRLNLERWMERRMLARCDGLFVTTDPTRTLYERTFPEIQGRVHVATMGYDEADFVGLPKPKGIGEHPGGIHLVHVGRIYDEARDAGGFARAVTLLGTHHPDLAGRLHVHLVGEVSAQARALLIGGAPPATIHFPGWVSHRESLAWMRHADGLLLFGNRGGVQIPGKTYLYLGARRPILLITRTGSDPTAEIVRRSRAGVVVQNVPEAIATAIDRLTSPAGRSGEAEFSEVAEDRDRYTWARIAARMMDEIIGSSLPAGPVPTPSLIE